HCCSSSQNQHCCSSQNQHCCSSRNQHCCSSWNQHCCSSQNQHCCSLWNQHCCSPLTEPALLQLTHRTSTAAACSRNQLKPSELQEESRAVITEHWSSLGERVSNKGGQVGKSGSGPAGKGEWQTQSSICLKKGSTGK
uniref:Uncharacterized protein n=1 Tax=Taeniopygia guttata TaxID=59729 RepID=A0A674GJB9_TAEGU